MHIWDRIDGRIAGRTPVTPVGKGMIRIGEDAMLGMPAYLLDCGARAEYVLAEFDAAGVDVGVVVQEYMDGEQNDYVLNVLEQHPDRFFMHGIPDYWDLDRTERDARQLFDRGFHGLKLPAGHLVGKVPLDLEKLMPIWRFMEDQGHVLAVDLSEGEAQVGQMEHILGECPALRVAVGHFGMPTRQGWPGQLRLAQHEHVYIETGGIVWLYRDDGYPFLGAVDAIKRARDEVGIEKIMWGSDWPRTMIDFTYRQSLDFLRLCEAFSSKERGAMLGENARRLYRLPEPAAPRQPVALVTES